MTISRCCLSYCTWICFVKLLYVGPEPIATPLPPTIVQLATILPNGFYVVLTYDQLTGLLTFKPPSEDVVLLKQTWRETPSSSISFVSLQVKYDSPQSEGKSLFITRTSANPPVLFLKNESFSAANVESRLFRSKCCNCGRSRALTTYFYPALQAGSGEVATSILTSSAAFAGLENVLTFAQSRPSADVICATSGLLLNTYPIVEPVAPSYVLHRRKRDTGSRIPIKIFVDFGNITYSAAVLRLGPDVYDLRVTRYRGKCLEPAIFFYREYMSYTVTLEGTLINITAVTLQHKDSRRYLVADVLDTLQLNLGNGSTGLTLRKETEYENCYPRFPDYRFFLRHDLQLQQAHITLLCPLFHRQYCIYPASHGSLRLNSVLFNDTRRGPTFVNPTFSQFLNFTERAREDTATPSLPSLILKGF